MKVQGSNNYIDIEETEVIDFCEKLYETEIDNMKQRVLEKMQEKPISRKKSGIKIAVIAIVCAILVPGSVYAANKLNLFGNIFGGADETPVGSYIEFASDENKIDVDTDVISEKIYVDSNDTYEITADYCMYNQETSAGVLQFTITNRTGDGRQWYEIASVHEYYDDWDLGIRDIPELYPLYKEGYFSFEVAGLGYDAFRVYLKESESDANKKICIIVFDDCKKIDVSTVNLKLVVKEWQYNAEGTAMTLTPILTVDIPKGETVPNLKWVDEKGDVKVILSSFDYFVYGIDDGGQDVSIKLKDGSEYHILNNEKKILNALYNTLPYEGIWGAFCTILDLNEVEAFCFDGVEYHASDAIMQ